MTGIFDDLIEANKQAEMKQKGVKFFWGIYNVRIRLIFILFRKSKT